MEMRTKQNRCRIVDAQGYHKLDERTRRIILTRIIKYTVSQNNITNRKSVIIIHWNVYDCFESSMRMGSVKSLYR